MSCGLPLVYLLVMTVAKRDADLGSATRTPAFLDGGCSGIWITRKSQGCACVCARFFSHDLVLPGYWFVTYTWPSSYKRVKGRIHTAEKLIPGQYHQLHWRRSHACGRQHARVTLHTVPHCRCFMSFVFLGVAMRFLCVTHHHFVIKEAPSAQAPPENLHKPFLFSL